MPDVTTAAPAQGPQAQTGQPTKEQPSRARISDFGDPSMFGKPTQIVGPDPIKPALRDPSLIALMEPPEPANLARVGDEVPEVEADDAHAAEVVPEGELAALQAKWAQPELHEELLDRIVSPVIDGVSYPVTVREAIKGYQRQEVSSWRFGEAKQMLQAAQQKEAGLSQLVGGAADGKGFMHMVRFLGLQKGFHEAAEAYAVIMAEELRLPPAEQESRRRARIAEERVAQLAQQNQMLQQVLQQQKPPDLDRQTAAVGHQLEQMIPLAAKRFGIELTQDAQGRMQLDPLSQQVFRLHWDNMVDTFGHELTTDDVMQVMAATKQTIDRYMAGSAEERARRAQLRSQQVPPASRVSATAPPAPGQNPGQRPARASVSDFKKVILGGGQ